MPLIDLEGKTNVELFNQVYREEQVPVVQLGLALPGCDAPAVVTDEIEGMLHGVRLLHAMGHQRIAHLTIPGYDNPEPLNPFRIARLRYEGYQRAVAELGLREQVFCPTSSVETVETMFDASVAVASQVAAAAERPSAVIAFSNYGAAGLMAGLADAGLSVPRDISVLAVGEQPFDRMLRPALSTLSPQFEKMGEIATRTLLSMIEGGEARSTTLAPTLTMRDSVIERKAS
jgi:LacI family transcriptional regulator